MNSFMSIDLQCVAKTRCAVDKRYAACVQSWRGITTFLTSHCIDLSLKDLIIRANTNNGPVH